jgi:hypothetical protein
MVAAIGTGDAFTKGRDFAAWLGLVPKQMSTGDRTILGNIQAGQSLPARSVRAGGLGRVDKFFTRVNYAAGRLRIVGRHVGYERSHSFSPIQARLRQDAVEAGPRMKYVDGGRMW